MNNLSQRITINPKVCFGKPTIRNMRYPVQMILELLAAGMSQKEILADYPDLENDDILACFWFVSRLLQVKSIHKTHLS
jgi:uncharacterized protein (DUF433 family)